VVAGRAEPVELRAGVTVLDLHARYGEPAALADPAALAAQAVTHAVAAVDP
jgi:hypothetical protein